MSAPFWCVCESNESNCLKSLSFWSVTGVRAAGVYFPVKFRAGWITITAAAPALPFVPSGYESQMPSTWYPQFGSAVSLIINSSNPATTVPLIRTIFPLNDAGFFTTSHTVTSTTCACRPSPNPKMSPATTRQRFIETLSSRSNRNGSKLNSTGIRRDWELPRISCRDSNSRTSAGSRNR